jgi:hypothetical protein
MEHSVRDNLNILQFFRRNNCELVGFHRVKSEWPIYTYYVLSFLNIVS